MKTFVEKWRIAIATAAVLLAGAREARALDGVVDATAEEPRGEVSPVEIASVGTFLSLSQPASVEGWRAVAVSFAGYDSARDSGTFEAATEVRVWGPLSIRAGSVYVSSSNTLRPSVGGRIQAFNQKRHAIDGSFGVFYRPEGLTEPEGEIESIVSLGRHVGQTYLLGNLLYGQDPEGNERDGEVRFAALRAVGASARFVFGVDSRVRFDLGSDPAKLAMHGEPTFDALVGPSATVLLGPVALSLQGGGSARRLAQNTSYGAFVITGVGIPFGRATY